MQAAGKEGISALNQQRSKLRPEALQAILAQFNDSVSGQAGFPFADVGYRFLAADGSTTTFFSTPELAPQEYFCSPGHSASGVYSIHINAFFDFDAHIYTDAILQPVHEKNEFGAFCDIADRHGTLPGRKNVYIGDRGYCSYNNMAHVVEQGQYFLFREKKELLSLYNAIKRAEGRQEGLLEGRLESTRRINALHKRLLEEGRPEDLKRSTKDPEYQELLLKEYGL